MAAITSPERHNDSQPCVSGTHIATTAPTEPGSKKFGAVVGSGSINALALATYIDPTTAPNTQGILAHLSVWRRNVCFVPWRIHNGTVRNRSPKTCASPSFFGVFILLG